MHSEEQRLAFILEGQQHCDHFLTPIADPAGKRVLVAGSGAGTEMLWCLRRGAAEVVGIDILRQTEEALRAACDKLGIAPNFSMHQIAIEDAVKLGRRFDLLLSNNVFEHVSDLPRSLRACAELIEPDGRIAIFTDPLYFSSSGSHLPHDPWEHLWADGHDLREKLVAKLGPDHAVSKIAKFDEYLFKEISLNRMRITELLDAIRASGLFLVNLRVIPDRNLAVLPQYRDRVIHIPVLDLAIEGIAAELARPGATDLTSTEAVLLYRERQQHAAELRHLRESRSYRIGRAIAWPARWVRSWFQ